jgi:hypothetical protein
VDELREEIWDYLYRAGQSKSIDAIAQRVARDSATVREAVDHEWFQVQGGMVTISHGAPNS